MRRLSLLQYLFERVACKPGEVKSTPSNLSQFRVYYFCLTIKGVTKEGPKEVDSLRL